ncbi:hypothetical protein [Streptomyces sp. STR69]|uniref:hypothetical protein n=1 Tax=Streptomyces sp. STR69 TaxID=1796942 RepID=UPI0021C5FB1F|nr:hypothetical protein [Streptomyces sp. STR69]
MPYEYRCRKCRAASPPVTRRQAEGYREEHRNVEHGGLVPRGESIVRVPGSAPDPDGRYVSTGLVLATLVVLAVAEEIARLWGR